MRKKAGKFFIIAIDGPAGSGKSTTARKVAQRLGFFFLDSGAMYRAVTWLALENKVALNDSSALAVLAEKAVIDFRQQDGKQLIFVNGQDITRQIRLPDVTNAIAPIAANPVVRKILVEKQRVFGKLGNLVAEGRDIGTVVFPNADLKIYLNAPAKVRARRRVTELAEQGVEADFAAIYSALLLRDANDSNREHSPLRRAKGAVELDTGDLTIDEQVDRVVRLAKERME